MTRNPNKKRCQIPKCRSWSMHEHSHCRAHLDHQLGPRRASAPKATPTPSNPAATPTPSPPPSSKAKANSSPTSPLHTLILLARHLNQLLPHLADIEYTAGLATWLPAAFLQSLPPEKRPGIQSQIWKYALPLNSLQRPSLIKAIARPARHASQ